MTQATEEAVIRPATTRDFRTLREIERAAGRVFRDIDMAAVADDEPPALKVLQGYVRAGRAWTTERDGHPIAYLIADVVDGNAHIEQVSVHPEHAHHGHGRALIEHLARWAADGAHPALTLTTFLDVPWNGPYYRRCGFRLLAADEISPGLRTLREHEAARGLDRWPRGCMRRDLTVGQPPRRAATGQANQ
ncbi:MAG: GNAT family N-acetyltransferase [Pseudonocardia sp.]|nr:GNAT family N-acetyltransferase [Pseudonocardia sp.]